jgi:ABC-type multidrug transport system fused ATPase/permease subunit
MTRPPITRLEFLRTLLCPPLYIMVILMVVEALLGAATTWLVIRAGRNVANEHFLLSDLLWILAVQSASYVAGAVSWIYAERAGFRCYGRYMLRFARDNRRESRLLHDRAQREEAEPFLTGTTFNNVFNVIYEIEAQLKLLLGIALNAAVLGVEIDPSLAAAYAAVFAILTMLQWVLRGRIADAYLDNQRQNNRLVAHGYTAWDNVFAGNGYNLRLWLFGFKARLRDCLRAQIVAIVAREGLSAVDAIIGMVIVFSVLTYIVIANAGDTALLVALATTLPRQIEMIADVHEFASGWNDVVAVWTRVGDVVDHIQLAPDPAFNARIKFDRLLLRSGGKAAVCHSVDQALRLVYAEPTGRINVRGGNGTGKSTLLAVLKTEIKNRAYYWPTADRLAFRFAMAAKLDEDEELDEDDEPRPPKPIARPGFSSGERQLKSLQEIVEHTDAPIYLLDEWDANLDLANRGIAETLVEALSRRARVVEISHRDATLAAGDTAIVRGTS